MHIFSQTTSSTTTTTPITPISSVEGSSSTRIRKEEKFPAKESVTASSSPSNKDRKDLEPPLLLTSLSTENLITPISDSSEEKKESSSSIINLPENTKYSQKDNFQTTFGNYSNLNQSSSVGAYHNNYNSQHNSFQNNIQICDNTTTAATTNSFKTLNNYHHTNFERQRTPSSPPSYLSSISSNNNNNNPTIYYYQPVLYSQHQQYQEPILVLSSLNTNQLVSHHHPVHFQSSDLYHQRVRSHSLPLPRQARQLKTFQLTSTQDERLIQQQLPYQPTIMSSANNNLTVVQQYDNTSVSVSPLSPMPLLSDSGNIDTYREQFIAIIREGSAELLESEKECFDVLGTCPKSNTKAAYWYGKYGGPFTWKYNGVPIDDLDLVCRMHDQRLPLKFVKKLVNLIREHYGDRQLSKDALSYIKKIDGIAFRIIEPVYMIFFGCF